MMRKVLAELFLFLGKCPNCGGDAPELYTCRVCNGDKKMKKNDLRRRYEMSKCEHDAPMEDKCQECRKNITKKHPKFYSSSRG